MNRESWYKNRVPGSALLQPIVGNGDRGPRGSVGLDQPGEFRGGRMRFIRLKEARGQDR
jgi:hypothetical protein